MTRRLLFLSVIACLSKRLCAKVSVPVVRDLSELPDGVPGLLEYEPFAAWIKATGGQSRGPTYYLPAIGRNVLCIKTTWYGTDKPGPPTPVHSPYKELEETMLRDAIRGCNSNLIWVPVEQLNDTPQPGDDARGGRNG